MLPDRQLNHHVTKRSSNQRSLTELRPSSANGINNKTSNAVKNSTDKNSHKDGFKSFKSFKIDNKMVNKNAIVKKDNNNGDNSADNNHSSAKIKHYVYCSREQLLDIIKARDEEIDHLFSLLRSNNNDDSIVVVNDEIHNDYEIKNDNNRLLINKINSLAETVSELDNMLGKLKKEKLEKNYYPSSETNNKEKILITELSKDKNDNCDNCNKFIEKINELEMNQLHLKYSLDNFNFNHDSRDDKSACAPKIFTFLGLKVCNHDFDDRNIDIGSNVNSFKNDNNGVEIADVYKGPYPHNYKTNNEIIKALPGDVIYSAVVTKRYDNFRNIDDYSNFVNEIPLNASVQMCVIRNENRNNCIVHLPPVEPLIGYY